MEPNICRDNVYRLVIKKKILIHGDYNDAIVDRVGDLLWYRVPEKQKTKVQELYRDLTDQIIEVLTPATGERPLGEIFNRGIADCFPSPTNAENQ
ncbi:11280_t:CDS:1, partial [Racocetra fulgida]